MFLVAALLTRCLEKLPRKLLPSRLVGVNNSIMYGLLCLQFDILTEYGTWHAIDILQCISTNRRTDSKLFCCNSDRVPNYTYDNLNSDNENYTKNYADPLRLFLKTIASCFNKILIVIKPGTYKLCCLLPVCEHAFLFLAFVPEYRTVWQSAVLASYIHYGLKEISSCICQLDK